MKGYRIIIIFLLFTLLISNAIIAQNKYVNYTIQKGDTLTDIAKHFNIFIREIIALNNIKNPDIIQTGTELKIPVRKNIYTVNEGDTLYKIAKKFAVSINFLIELNNIKNPDNIYAGECLYLAKVEDENRNRKLNISRDSNLEFIWPVIGRISSPYGWRIHPIRGKREFHTGIDIAVSMGSPVYATEDGVVVFSGYSEGYGKLVIIQHRRNKSSYYAHNLELKVKRGDTVKRGKIIALSGNSGLSTGPHLHFEIRHNNKSEDPMKYLNQKYLRNGFKV